MSINSPIQLNIRRGNSTERTVDMDVISNKEVNIGLDLLMNQDKKRPTESSNGSHSSSSDLGRDDGRDSRDTRDTRDTRDQFDLSNYDDDDYKLESMVRPGSSNRDSDDLRSQNMEKLMSNLDLPMSGSPRVNPLADLDRGDHGESSSHRRAAFSDYDDDDKISRRFRDANEDLRDTRSRNGTSDEYGGYDRVPAFSRMSYEEERQEKEKVIYELEKMRRLGIQGIKRFNMSNDLEEMQFELNKIRKEREVESSVKFQRKVLMAFVTGVELLNNKFDYFNVHLDGWSETVHENQDEYNEVFEELHEKYGTKTKMAPELRLLFMLAGSAFMHHLSNSMFKTAMPGIGDILKQNPNLMNDFVKAASSQMPYPEQRQAAGLFSQFAQMGGSGGSSASRPSAPRPSSAQQSESIPDYEPRPEVKTSSIPSTTAPKKKSIPPPIGVDDVLNDLRSSSSNSSDISEIISQSERRPRKTLFQKPKQERSSVNSTLSL
jgi:hypothetical protein